MRLCELTEKISLAFEKVCQYFIEKGGKIVMSEEGAEMQLSFFIEKKE